MISVQQRLTMAGREGGLQTDAIIQQRPDFRSASMIIDNSLHDEDVASMKFLCQGLVVGSKLKRVDAAHELISLLESGNHVTENDFFLLADLLQYIQRIDVLQSIGYEEMEVVFERHQQGSRVNPFFVMLFQIAEELPDEDVKKAAYMYGKVPRSQKLSSGLDLFTVMVQHQTVGPDNVERLLNIFHSIERQDIIELINRYTETRGRSVMEDLEQSFARAMRLRGISIGDVLDIRPHLPPPPQDPPSAPKRQNPNAGHSAGGMGRGLGPSIHDRDVGDRHPPPSLQAPEGLSTMNNPPSSEPALSPSAPPPSLPTFNSSSQPSPPASHFSAAPQVQPSANPAPVIRSPPEGFNSYDIRWEVLDILSRNIPAEYWPAFSSHLGVPVTSDWSNTRMNRNHNLAVLKRWLNLPEMQAMDSQGRKASLVQALASAGPDLMAQEIAQMMDVNFEAIMQDSMTTRQGSSIGENDVASTGSAIPDTMNMNQPESLGAVVNAAVDPRTRLASMQRSPIPFYKMSRRPRGMCLIINNRNFYKDPNKVEAKEMVSRDGTDIDRDKLRVTFEQLDFLVMTRDNCTDHDMIQLVQYAATQSHQNFDCFTCCILTHGIQGALYGVNGVVVPIRDLTGPFRAQACPSLVGKPKLFFLQACQGREKQGGHHSDMDVDSVETDSPPELIPNESDFLLGYATVPGFVSYRSKTRGSWYITKLTENLNKHAYDHDILDILTLVNYEVGKGDALIEGGQYKQSPAPMYSLRKKLIFSRPC